MIQKYKRSRITVKGIVQGVGFRPAVAKQASAMGLTGKVLNARDSVEIEIQGSPEILSSYIDTFHDFIPPNALIAFFKTEVIAPVDDESGFRIIESRDSGPTRFSIPPDIAMCGECRKEFYDPEDRRYLYPFITCGNCGPRYTYMKDMPYDRQKTAMSEFPFCEECLKEYNDPDDRRYHIEGFSCPQCGPRVSGFDEGVNVLKNGGITAVKGLGGYYIACPAVDEGAVAILRERKRRPAKPFAVMFRSVEDARKCAFISDEEGRLLESKVSPIVLVRKKENSSIAENVAPGNGYLGVMIAYNPLHLLLLDRAGIPLVMTSANVSGDPLIIDDGKARTELSGIVDAFISHNREIYRRADDSVSFVHNGEEINVRMGRGKMPFPMKLPETSKRRILAAGAELKSNVSAVLEDNLVTSNHIGDLGTPDTFAHFTETVSEITSFYDIVPEAVVSDMHPDFESSVFAKELSEKNGSSLVKIQHHYAHFVSCYFENGLKGEAAGVLFDGTGYGGDGTVWGGEIFTGDLHSFVRRGRLSHFPLPGGEMAIREPWRILSGLLEPADFIEACSWVGGGAPENILRISGNRSFSPLTSSAGRLFDAAGALLGFTGRVTFEAEAAIFLEMLAMKSETVEAIHIQTHIGDGLCVMDVKGLIQKLYKRLKGREEKTDLARIFHNSLISSASEMVRSICSERGIDQVLLSGGVFQNRIMLPDMEKKLASMGLRVFINRRIPSNDAGISAGQAIYGVYNA